jgi:hypothetical protein
VTSSIFGDLEVRLEPWHADYGAELALEAAEETVPAESLSLDVELAPEAWQPIAPVTGAVAPNLVFVDGVRRIEARLIVRRGGRLCYGAFGSYAVGSVTVTNHAASYSALRVGRVLVIGAGESLIDSVTVAPALVYRPLTTILADPDGPLRAIQDEMRAAEEELGRELTNTDDTLVVIDGPLTFEQRVRGGAVGYVKRLFKLYVPSEKLDLIAELQAGQRTPIFALRSSRRFARYSWFLRLVPPGPGDSTLSGIVRLEVAEVVGAAGARRLADATALMLPQFAPNRWSDPRSPQNLLPIGALEFQLRRHLGDVRLVRRHIETLVAEEAVRG